MNILITSSEDLNSAKERSAVHLFATGAIKRLQEKDRKLPQVCVLGKIDWNIPASTINAAFSPFFLHTHTYTHIIIYTHKSHTTTGATRAGALQARPGRAPRRAPPHPQGGCVRYDGLVVGCFHVSLLFGRIIFCAVLGLTHTPSQHQTLPLACTRRMHRVSIVSLLPTPRPKPRSLALKRIASRPKPKQTTKTPVVEILFSRGLIKILFATETFAMGVNMVRQ